MTSSFGGRPCPRTRFGALGQGLTSLLTAASALLLAFAGIVVSALPSQAADSTLTFVGHGWGHGRGMGQYGALGYAVDYGWSYQQIVAHFYGGTSLQGGTPNSTIGVELTALTARASSPPAPA